MDRQAAKELLHIQTWLTLSRDLPAWQVSLKPLFASAAGTIALDQE